MLPSIPPKQLNTPYTMLVQHSFTATQNKKLRY